MKGAFEDELVSIITPAWRAAGLVEETIRSVLAQTYANWELLIADDCSPDDTRAVVSAWSARDPRIRLIARESNGGPAAARNSAISASRGRWLAFLDSDDLWLPEKLERTLAHAIRHSSPLTYTAFRRISFDGARIGRHISVPRALNYHQLLRNTAIVTSSVVIDRSRVQPIVMRKTYYDDFACWLEVLKPGRIAHGLDEDLVRYRIVPNSVSRSKMRSAVHVWRAYRDVEKLNIPNAVWYFVNYALNGMVKYRSF